MKPPKLTPKEKLQTIEFIPDGDDQKGYNFLPEACTIYATGKPTNQKSIMDLLINSEVLLYQGEEQWKWTKFIWWLTDENKIIIGRFDKNISLNTLIYNVEFPDGAVKRYAANNIVMDILIQVDYDGHNSKTLDGIVDYKRDGSAVSKDNSFITANRQVINLRQTTIVWKLLIQWKYGTTTWTPINILKEFNPVEVPEVLVKRGISDKPEISWWVAFTFKNRDRIIDTVKSRVGKKTHKFGIEFPMYIENANRLDANNWDMLWQDAIANDMYQVLVAFNILEDGESLPPRWTHHLIILYLMWKLTSIGRQ